VVLLLWQSTFIVTNEAGGGTLEPEETDLEMTDPLHDASAPHRAAELSLEHTRRLGESRPDGQYTPDWYAETAYVGDLTALAAASLAQPRRA
jgi:hypothetical protein